MIFNPKFSITNKIANALTTIERTRGFLDAAKLSENWIEKMQSRALILEAHHTTHIEGAQLTLYEAEKLLSGEQLPEVNADDARELLNYREAFDFVSDYIFSHGNISEGLVREIHKKLVQKVRGNSALPGQYRTVQNYVVNSRTKEVIYKPPDAYEVPRLMAELTEWLREEEATPAILIAGIAQFQLVHIHPFLDGNGRTARLLSTLCLYRSGYDFKQLFSISEYYDRNRMEYYQAIQSVRENGLDMTLWLEYFCVALETQMKEIQNKGSRAIKLDILELQGKISERQKSALESLIEKKRFTIQDYETFCFGVSRRSLQRDLSDLVKKGFLSQVGTKKFVFYQINPFWQE